MKIFRIVIVISLVLAFLVVMLGAYTRLTDAGLGCPDWPGCYGKLVLPFSKDSLNKVQSTYPKIPIEEAKAWTEMAHRYLAGTLVFLILFIIFKSLHSFRTKLYLPWLVPIALLLLVALQAALGMWTVTLKLLPIVVMGHLLGGMLIFACLVYFYWQFSGVNGLNLKRLKIFVNLGLIIVFTQIALGGLVSSNYAGIACIGFPRCNGQWLPALNFAQAFDVFTPVGANYQGGLLDSFSRVTLQIIHRLGAVVTLFYLLIFGSYVIVTNTNKLLKLIALLVVILVSLQFILGILNVIYLLPLWVAVAHNGCAALLLGSMVSLRYLVSNGGMHVRNT